MYKRQNDTYEPGSTFKIITTAAALEEQVVSLDSPFFCPGYKVVDDRRIRCHKVGGHGSETFTQGIMNSCNPVFIELGLRLGVDRFYQYFEQFGLLEKTGIDVPGEAGTIMHDPKNMGPVELATVSFGQSFQITPVQPVSYTHLDVYKRQEQVRVLPISEKYADYAEKIRKELARNEIDVTMDNRSEKIGYKIREARLDKVPYMLVVGQKEEEEGTVSVRSRYAGDEGQKPLSEFIDAICKEIRTKEIRKIENPDA